jgi:hypothetical protein
MFDVEKMVQICGYMLKKYEHRLNYIKLIKLLYLADKASLKNSTHAITGDIYISMKNGPVLSQLYDLIRGKYTDHAVQMTWDCRFTKDGYDLIAISDRIPDGELSPFETDVLDAVDAQFHDTSYRDMIEYVHRPDICPEWREPDAMAQPIDFQDVLKSIGYAGEEIAWLIEENKIFDEEEKLFACLTEA